MGRGGAGGGGAGGAGGGGPGGGAGGGPRGAEGVGALGMARLHRSESSLCTTGVIDGHMFTKTLYCRM